MSLLDKFKPHKDRDLHLICRMLLSAGITPNVVTAFGLLVSVLAGVVAGSGHLYAGIVIFLMGAGLDVVDGSLARNAGLCTEFGRYFDSICDRLSEAVFIAGAVIGGVPSITFMVVAGSVLLLASRVVNHQKGLDSDAAMFGRPERLTLLVAGLLSPSPINAILVVTNTLLSLVSSYQVLASGAKAEKSNENAIAAEQ
ncbi:MAG: CDP-alcohol phosphatidyltransferase family protein [Methanospirillum sp.]